MKKTMTTDEIRNRFASIFGRYNVSKKDVAEAIGLSREHFTRVMNGAHEPHGVFRDRMIDWLDAHEAEYPIDANAAAEGTA